MDNENNELRLETSIGTLVARINPYPDHYPGISIELVRDGNKHYPSVLMEIDNNEKSVAIKYWKDGFVVGNLIEITNEDLRKADSEDNTI